VEEQRRRWQRGDRIPVEAFLQRQPGLQADTETILDLIYNEFLLREERGEEPQPAEYLQRFPHLATPLQVQFEVDRALAPGALVRSTLPGPLGYSEGLVAGGQPGLPVIAEYQVQEKIGQGAMGIVYRAVQLHLQRVVALKVIRAGAEATPEELARFRREAEAVAQLQHPHIVQIFAVGEWRATEAGPPVPFLALEYVEGGPLSRALAGHPQPGREAARLAAVLARAIHHAHQRGVIHRDLKPANILLAGPPARGGVTPGTGPAGAAPLPAEVVPKIADFGLARRLQAPGLTRTDAILGTPEYMAPEQARGKPDALSAATDVYALGAILYEMLTGRPPFRGETPLDTLAQLTSDDPVGPRQLQPKVPADLETICLKCLQKEPRQRYRSAQELAEDLDRFLRHEPIRARPLGPGGRLLKWARRQPVVAALLALVVAVAVAGFGLVTWQWLETRHEWRRAEDQRQLTEEALGQAQAARADAETRRGQAQAAEQQATANARAEKAARQKADRLVVQMALERGQGLCEQGEPGRGLLWLAHGLTLAAQAQAEDLDRTIRMNLGAWRRQVCARKAELRWAGSGGAVALSPDGRTLLSATGLRAAYLHDATTGRVREDIPFTHGDRVLAVAFSPDGKTVLTGSNDKTARLWDAATAKPLGEPLDHPAPVYSVAFRADGKAILTGCGDAARGEAWLWEAPGGKKLGGPLKHGAAVRAAAFSPDGGTVLTGSEDHTARLWVAATGQPRGEPLQHEGPVLAATFSPDGKTVLTGDDGSARLWEVGTGRPHGASLPHGEQVFAVAYSPDGRIILTGCLSVARFWDATSRKPVGSPLPCRGGAYAVAFRRDGQAVMTAGTGVQFWEAADGKTEGAPLWQADFVRAGAYSPDGRAVVIGGGWGLAAAQVRDAATGRQTGLLMQHNGPVLAVAFSPDGKTILTGSHDKTARLWRAATGEPLLGPLLHEGWVGAVAFSPLGEDSSGKLGKTLLTGSDDKTACLWDAATGRQIGETLRHDGAVTLVAFSPNGKTVLTAGADRTARLWDATTGKPLGKPLRHQDAVSAAAFSPDGETVLTGSLDRQARLWKVSGEPLGPSLGHPGMIHFTVFDPDGRTFLTGGDKAVRVWQAGSDKPEGVQFQHEEEVTALAFSPDRRTVLTGGFDQTARLWDARTWKPIGPPLRHRNRVATLAYGPDGRTVLVLFGDERACCWEVPVPVAGEASRIVLWAQVLTGMELDEEGVVRVLIPETWEERRRRLEKWPGPPLP
jgi:WD40 repeat protein/serine/threonine protein kinase